MSVIVGSIGLWICIGRDIVDGILQIVEYHLIHLGRCSLWHILLSSYSKQGHIAEHTNQVEVKDSAQSVALTHIGALQRLVLPLYLWLILYELITAVDTLVIACPVGLIQVEV